MAPPTMTQRASDCDSGAPTMPARLVGEAFAQHYYGVLHRSPDEAYRFYHDDSCLVQPSASGDGAAAADCVTTLRAIKVKISETCRGLGLTELLTVDSHRSHGGGVAVLVTGRNTFVGDDAVSRRAFAQSFFLAPQEGGGYYVRNDTLRYVGSLTIAGAATAASAKNSPAMAAADDEKCPGSGPSAALLSKVIAAAEHRRRRMASKMLPDQIDSIISTENSED